MGVRLEDLAEPYRTQARAKIRAAGSAAKLERGSVHEPVATKETARYSGRVSLVYSQVRKRLLDPDNAASKNFTDSLVTCGILHDDNSSVIEKVTHEQRKAAKGEAEKTIVEIWV